MPGVLGFPEHVDERCPDNLRHAVGVVEIVYRGENLYRYVPGGWVIFQRDKGVGGGYWVGRTWDGFYEFGQEKPVSLHDGLQFIAAWARTQKLAAETDYFDDGFTLG